MSTHANGTVNLPGTLAVTYAGNVQVSVGGSFSTCTGPTTGCHMGSVTPNWNGGTTNCGTCHGYPPSTGTNHLDANRTGYAANTDTSFVAAHDECSFCHGISGNTTYPTVPSAFGTPVDKTPTGDLYVVGTMHGDGSVQINGVGGANAPYTENTGYNATTWACDNAACHTNAIKFVNSTSSYPVQLREFGAGACETCHDGTKALAPDVMTYWSGSAGGQDGGHGDPGGAPALACTDCHDLSQPTSPASAQHGTGVYNSLWANDSTRSTNTSHLKADFFTKYPANGAGDWSVQVAFDRYCNWECHDVNKDDVWDTTEVASFMWHAKLHPELGETTSDANYRSVEFGTHLTKPTGSADTIVGMPIDADLNTDAIGGGAYAPCISCHDPHGTGTAKPVGKPSNYMMRFEWPATANTLCSKCHI